MHNQDADWSQRMKHLDLAETNKMKFERNVKFWISVQNINHKYMKWGTHFGISEF